MVVSIDRLKPALGCLVDPVGAAPRAPRGGGPGIEDRENEKQTTGIQGFFAKESLGREKRKKIKKKQKKDSVLLPQLGQVVPHSPLVSRYGRVRRPTVPYQA